MPKTKEEEEEARRKAADAERTSEEDEETETQEEEEDLSVEELKSRLAKAEKDRRAANKEAKERRLRLEALEKEKKDREEAELSEKEKLEKSVTEKDTELETLRKENHSLKLSGLLDETAGDLKISFVSAKAKATALRLLDMEAVGDDFSGLSDALKALYKSDPYLFGKPDPNQFIDDGRRKDKVSSSTVTAQAKDKQKQRLTPL